MPLLNPGIVVNSPFLADTFTRTRRTQVVSDLGRATRTAEHLCGHGIVTMATSKDLEMLAEEQHADQVISVISQMELRGPTPGADPDMITWAGTSYKVMLAKPHPRFGQGWYKVLAGSMNAIDLMPEVDHGE